MRTIIKFSISVLLLLIALVVLVNIKDQPIAARVFSPVKDTILENLPFVDKPSLSEIVDSSLDKTKGEYSLVIKNLKTGKTYMRNENRVYKSASLYKLWVMATVFEKIKKEEVKENEILSSSIPDLYSKFDLATESAEFSEDIIELSVINALTQMIVISHNHSALLLSNRVGNPSVSDFLKEYKFVNSKISYPPITTAKDIANFFEKLYKGEIIDRAYSDRMTELLKKQQINDRIPKLLPKDIKVAHKTGEFEGVKHDAGIVFAQNGDYIFVALSQSNNPRGAAERISIVSKAVFDYFNE